MVRCCSFVAAQTWAASAHLAVRRAEAENGNITTHDKGSLSGNTHYVPAITAPCFAWSLLIGLSKRDFDEALDDRTCIRQPFPCSDSLGSSV